MGQGAPEVAQAAFQGDDLAPQFGTAFTDRREGVFGGVQGKVGHTPEMGVDRLEGLWPCVIIRLVSDIIRITAMYMIRLSSR